MKIALIDSGVGLIPFVKYILKERLLNSYYCYMDSELFPYGDKKEAILIKQVEKIFDNLEKEGCQIVLICCNTLSLIYRKVKKKYSFIIRDILSLNLKLLDSKSTLLCTPFLKKKLKVKGRVISGKNLAYLIETKDIKAIVSLLKSLNLKGRVVLSCTHYPLIEFIIKRIYPQLEITYAIEELLKDIPMNEHLEITGNKKAEEQLNKYFRNVLNPILE